MDRFTDDGHRQMQEILDELGRAALEKQEPERIVDLDLSFHDYICRLADHSRLVRCLAQREYPGSGPGRVDEQDPLQSSRGAQGAAPR